MINSQDVYRVLSAMLPLYVAMGLGFASIRWFKLFDAQQSVGINRFVALIAVPMLNFQITSSTNLYEINIKFLSADSLTKLLVLLLLLLWAKLLALPRGRSQDWTEGWVTAVFLVAAMPNTLIIGVPLLTAMYGKQAEQLMAQIVVLQVVLWLPLVLVLFALQLARKESFRILSRSLSVVPEESTGGRFAGRSASSRERSLPVGAGGGSESDEAKKRIEQVSVGSSRRQVSFADTEHEVGDERGEEKGAVGRGVEGGGWEEGGLHRRNFELDDGVEREGRGEGGATKERGEGEERLEEAEKEEERPVVVEIDEDEGFCSVNGRDGGTGREERGGMDGMERGEEVEHLANGKEERGEECRQTLQDAEAKSKKKGDESTGAAGGKEERAAMLQAAKAVIRRSKKEKENEMDGMEGEEQQDEAEEEGEEGGEGETAKSAPLSQRQLSGRDRRRFLGVMLRVLAVHVLKNANTYAAVLGVAVSLLLYGIDSPMPLILEKSIAIVANTGLGMAMFSLGIFMAGQKSLVPCGIATASWTFLIRFLATPLLTAGFALLLGLRGTLFKIAAVQAALPQGIITFVYSNEYKVHPEVASTGVSLGTLVSFPILLTYYICLDLT